jgi:uncharacterized protein YdaU (DUF1376 family)
MYPRCERRIAGQIASPFRAVPYLTESLTRQGADQPEFSPDRGQRRRRLALHYYTFNIGDYRRDTFHLTLLEHGVYRQLIDSYYLNEKPLPPDTAVVMRTHSARTKEEKSAVLAVLENFFSLTEEGWVHKGCEKNIEQYRKKSDLARVSAETRWSKRNANALPTDSDRYANHKPITNNHKPIKKNIGAEAPLDVQESVWNDFLAIRKAKRAPLTETALDGIKREAALAGWDLNKALSECITRGWTGFKAEWVINRASFNGNKQEALEARNNEVVRRLIEKEMQLGNA